MTSSLNEGGTAVFRPSFSGLSFVYGQLSGAFKGDQKMRTYQVKQKFRLGGERFDIKDELGNVEYQVEGSFLKIPKTFTIYDKNGQEVSHITKKQSAFFPSLWLS